MHSYEFQRSTFFCRATAVLGCSTFIWFGSVMPSFSDFLLEMAREQAAQERGGLTIVEWIWGFSDQPSVIQVVGLNFVFSAVVGVVLHLLIIHFDMPDKEEFSQGIRWAAYVALLIPFVGFQGATDFTITEWLVRSTFIIGFSTLFAFVAGYVFAFIRNKFWTPNAGSRKFYETALAELETSTIVKGLWAQCLAKSNGDETAARANYLKIRAADLKKHERHLESTVGHRPCYCGSGLKMRYCCGMQKE